MKNSCMLTISTLNKDILLLLLLLLLLHESHQGITKCRERANGAFWWPFISHDIKTRIQNCAVCRQNQPTQRQQPLQPVDLPERPWVKLGTDLLEHEKKTYLVVIDYYSRFLEVKRLTTTTSAAVISSLRAMFRVHGIPEIVTSDNGPQYTSQEFADIAAYWGFKHETTNPYMSQENGMAERAVKTAKELLRLPDPEIGLLNYNATPHSATNVPPSVALMGRHIRTRLPVLSHNLQPVKPDDSAIRQSDKAAKGTYKLNYDRRHGARALPALQPGQPVLVKLDHEKQWIKPATVVSTSKDNRSYIVETEDGTRRRNRKHLIPDIPEPPETVGDPPTRNGAQHKDAQLREPETVPESGPVPPASPETNGSRTSSGRVIRKPTCYQDYV